MKSALKKQKWFLFVMVYLLSIILLTTVGIIVYFSNLSSEKRIIQKNEEHNLSLQGTLISSELLPVLEDLLYLSDPGYLINVQNRELTTQDIRRLERIYLAFSSRRRIYSSLRLITPDNRELIHIKEMNNSFRPLPDEELRDLEKECEYQSYFILKDKILYFSGIEHSSEKGDIMDPSDMVIRSAIEVKDPLGNPMGTLVLHFKAQKALLRIRDVAVHSLGTIILLSQDCEILFSSNTMNLNLEEIQERLKERIAWGGEGYHWTEFGLCTYNTVYPLASVLMEGEGLSPEDASLEESGALDYDWRLVSFVPMDNVHTRVQVVIRWVVTGCIILLILFALLSWVIASVIIRKREMDYNLKEEAFLFNNNPSPILQVNELGRIEKFNLSARKIWHRPLDNLPIQELFPTFDSSFFRGLKPEKPYSFEEKIGKSYLLFTLVSEKEGGNFFLYGSDISARKTIEENIKMLSLAVEQSANVIVITDIKGDIIFINKAFEKATGYTKGEVLGKNPRVLKSGYQAPEVYRELWGKISSGEIWHGELLNKRKDGTLFWEEAVITPIKDSEGIITNYLSVKEDITRRKIAEEELKKAKDVAEQANRLKSEFLANMSHEIRTPLNAILGFTSMLLETTEKRDVREKLEIIDRSGKILLNLINDILDFSKIEAGKIIIDKKPFNFSTLVDNLKSLFYLKSKEKELFYDLEIDDNFPYLVYGDEHRIAQILINILSNAFKFTDRGGVTLSCSYLEGTAVIKVADTGIGIKEDKVKTIFSAFEQADSSTERRYGGTGLGLSISKGLAELMEGQLYVHSNPGEGSIFTLIIPLPPGEPLRKENNSQVPMRRDLTSEKSRQFQLSKGELPAILYAEDNKINQALIVAFLKGMGLSCDIAEDGQQTLDLLANKKYNLLLLDMQMPVLDGVEVLKRIRQDPQYRNLSIIALTAHAMKGDKEKYLELGCDDYIPKPVDSDLFRSKIEGFFPGVIKPKGEPGKGDIVTVMDYFLSEKERSLIHQVLEEVGEHNIFNPQKIKTGAEKLLASENSYVKESGLKLIEAAESFNDQRVFEILKDLTERMRNERG